MLKPGNRAVQTYWAQVTPHWMGPKTIATRPGRAKSLMAAVAAKALNVDRRMAGWVLRRLLDRSKKGRKDLEHLRNARSAQHVDRDAIGLEIPSVRM